jgi:hypothetical protein
MRIVLPRIAPTKITLIKAGEAVTVEGALRDFERRVMVAASLHLTHVA